MYKRYSVIFILIVFMFIGCAGMGINLNTPEKKYLGARAELNILLSEYIQIQDKVSTNDHKNAKNAFLAADVALDAWEARLGDSNYDYAKNLKLWLEAKNTIINIIQIYGGKI